MSNNQNNLGSVVSLFRYPVKSMMGEELNATDITQRGLLGDRVYAIVDSSNRKVGSAKNPRKWPNLFDFRAAFIETPLAGSKIDRKSTRLNSSHSQSSYAVFSLKKKTH